MGLLCLIFDIGCANKRTLDIENRVLNHMTQEQLMNISQTCTQNVKAGNVVRVIGSKGVVVKNIHQQNTLRTICAMNLMIDHLQKAGASTELINDIKSLQKADGLLAKNEDTTNIRNNTQNIIDQRMMTNIEKRCEQKVQADNVIEIIGSENVEVADIIQTNDVYNECLQGEMIKAAQDAGMDIKTITKSSSKQDSEAHLFSFKNIMIAVVAIVILIGVGIVAKLLMSGKGKTLDGGMLRSPSHLKSVGFLHNMYGGWNS